MESEENFVSFIFCDEIFHDSCADDCCSYEEFKEWDDSIIKQKKKKGTIYMRTRC